MIKRLSWLMVASGLLPAVSLAGDGTRPILVQAGPFVKVYDASVGEKKQWYINDHCVVRGDDDRWHLFGITHEEPFKPLAEISFAHATAVDLVQQPWNKRPYALTVAPGAPWYEKHLWAPHVISWGSTYYMYYCAGGQDDTRYKIHLAVSTDLKVWARHPKNPMVVDGYGARDPFILRHGGQWLMYYTATSAPSGGRHVVACVCSDDLVTWRRKRVVFVDPSVGTYGGPTESPFIVRRGKSFYLFTGPRPSYNGTDVFVSSDPFRWEIKNCVGHIPSHAAEVVRDIDGQWYVSRAGWGEGGVYLAKLAWFDGQTDGDTSMPPPSP